MRVILNNVKGNRFNTPSIDAPQRYIPKNGVDTVSFSGGKIGLKQIGLGQFSKYAKFDKYSPKIHEFKGYKLPVHNDKIAPYLRDHYTPESFKDLFNFADSKGVFNINVGHNGLVKTAVINSGEDATMADNIWVTDTCRNMSLLKKNNPDLCTVALSQLSEFYTRQENEFNKIIENPELFKNNLNWFTRTGVGHVFNPKTLETNPIFIKSRIESMGLYLQTAADLIKGGIIEGKNYGYKDAAHIDIETVDAVSSCVKYLKSIDYPNAPSCGAWEEQTFKHSLTSDTSIINEGLRKIFKLVYSKTDNKEIQTFRKELLESKHGDVFADKKGLKDLITNGEKRVRDNHSGEAPWERELDAALSFVTHSEKLSTKGLVEDVVENMAVLEKIEALVGENGIARYKGDKYKNHDYDLKPKGFALKLTEFLAPKNLQKENKEAEWFMVSDIAKGYGTQIKKITNMLIKEKRKPDGAEITLLNQLIAKETEYINRSYARITGENSYKANGKLSPAFKAPEAHQAVTDSKGNIKFVPGTNTPLAWAQASLLDASNLYSENLADLKKVGLNNWQQYFDFVALEKRLNG